MSQRTGTCQDCGASFEVASPKGPISPRCPDCRVAHRREWEKSPEAKARKAARGKRWRTENPEKNQAKNDRFWANNPDYKRRWYEDHKDEAIARADAWNKAHPEVVSAYQRRRRATDAERHRMVMKEARRRHQKRQTAVADFTVADVIDLYGTECGICGADIDMSLRAPDGDSFSIDHIVPLARDGGHLLSNVQPAHLRCNVAKGVRIA